MAFRSRELMKKLVKKVGGDKSLAPGVKEQLKKSLPDNKIVMGRAHRGLYAGRHIQFGNRVSEDGGNKYVFISKIFGINIRKIFVDGNCYFSCGVWKFLWGCIWEILVLEL